MDNALNHFDEKGKARMVDVSHKSDTLREAIAKGMIRMQASTLNIIREGKMEKGDVLGVARVAAVMASKKTSDVIPMCHPLFITGCDIEFTLDDKENAVIIEAKVRTTGKTGVEMEALTAVSIATLTIYDMCKAVDKGMIIEGIHLVKKSGGKSGEWCFKE